jgi:tetratricopeptide (TPR) repeat protein
MQLRTDTPHASSPWTALILLSVLQACQPAAKVDPPKAATQTSVPTASPSTSAATGIAPWRRTLLDQATQVASSVDDSIKVHKKTKARLQREAVEAALSIGLTDLAIANAQTIDGPQRGEALALAAQTLVRAGERERAKTLLAKALDIGSKEEGVSRQRVLTEVAVGFALAGEVDEARKVSATLPAEYTGRIEVELIAVLPPSQLDAQCDAFDHAIATQNLDVARSGIDGYIMVMKRVRTDPNRLDRAARAVRAALPNLAGGMQIETRIQFADALDASGQRDAATQELLAAEKVFHQGGFAEDELGVLARDLARAKARMGDQAGARDMLQRLLA